MKPPTCYTCEEYEYLRTCEECDRLFCEHHGQRGGDRHGIARPSLCDKCRLNEEN